MDSQTAPEAGRVTVGFMQSYPEDNLEDNLMVRVCVHA